MNKIACIALLAGALLFGVSGCGFDPGDSSTSNSGGSSGSSGTAGSGGASGSSGTASAIPGCYDDPAQGPLLDECGIWVSNSLGDDANAGSQSQPVASLARAVELAKAGKGKVYACGETWTDPIIVPGDVSLHGGFDCKDGWAYVGKDRRASIVTAPGQIPLRMFEGVDNVIWRLTDFHIEAADAVEPSGSSIAMFIGVHIEPLDQPTENYDYAIEILRSEILARNGADGLDGEPGDPDNPVAIPGIPGNPGADACSAGLSKGGAAPEVICNPENNYSQGGAGGNSGPMLAANGKTAETQFLQPGGQGGYGEQNLPNCTAGEAGDDGKAGQYGDGGRGNRRFLPKGGYRGASGDDGWWGKNGHGGGGGGATFGSAAVCGAAKPGGAAGGSGGTGGCGGRPGTGGQPGGASLALMTASAVVASDTLFATGKGGKGGNGGVGQKGALGAAGGQGGAGYGTIHPGCKGGDGGNGGDGGWGGGGQGGPAYPITFLNLESGKFGDFVGSAECTLKYGTPGPGGLGGGDPMNPFGEGNDGWEGGDLDLWPAME